MFGRMYNETAAKIGAVWIFLAFNLTFLPQFVLGSQGMPRRYHTYDMFNPDIIPFMQGLHAASTIGSHLLGLGLLFTFGVLVLSLIRGDRAAANQWAGLSLEWVASSPPSTHNFEEPPVVTQGPYEFPEIDHGLGKSKA